MKEFKSWRSGVLAVIATAALGWVAVATGGCSSSPATVVVVAEGGINCGACS